LEGPIPIFSSIRQFPEVLQKGIICLYCSAIMLQFLGSSQREQWSVLNLIQNPQRT
jgi:hypothetical protein